MERRNLINERDYHIDRLTEISAELKRLTAEGDALKAELDESLEAPSDRPRAIQRRRRYIGRRTTELKSEREAAIARRDNLNEQLKHEVVS